MGILLLCTTLYLVSLLLTLLAGEHGVAIMRRTSIWLILVPIGLSAVISQIPGIGVLLLFTMIPTLFLPMLSVGIGLLVGSFSRALRLRGRGPVGWGILGGAIVLPAMGFAVMISQQMERIAERRAALEAFQSLTIEGRIGEETIALPASPQIET